MQLIILLGLFFTVVAEYGVVVVLVVCGTMYVEIDQLSREIYAMAQNITAYIYGTKEPIYETKSFYADEMSGHLGLQKLRSIKNFLQLNYGGILNKISRPTFGGNDEKKYQIYRELKEYEDQLVDLWFGPDFLESRGPKDKQEFLRRSHDMIFYAKVFNSFDEFEGVKNRFFEVHGPLLTKKDGKSSFESILRRLNVRATTSIGPYASYEKKYRTRVIDGILDYFPEDEVKDRLREKLEMYSTKTLEELEKNLGAKEYSK